MSIDPATLDRWQAVCDAATAPDWQVIEKRVPLGETGDYDEYVKVCTSNLNEIICDKWDYSEQDMRNFYCIGLARTALPLAIAALRERAWRPIADMKREDMEAARLFILWSPSTHIEPREGCFWTQHNEWQDLEGDRMEPTYFTTLPAPPQQEG